MKRLFYVLVLVCACAVAAAGSALASRPAGKGPQTLTASCSVAGAVTVHASNGASAWVNNTHYVLVKLMGTFTPIGGTAQSFTKLYGHKTGFRPASVQTCTGSQAGPVGTLSFTAWVARTPAH
jgi:hypothetical protein